MTKEKTLGEIAAIEAQIRSLTKERNELREKAVTKGWAMWTFTVRQTAPSLAWWKEHRPSTWQKHVKSTEVKRFEIV